MLGRKGYTPEETKEVIEKNNTEISDIEKKLSNFYKSEIGIKFKALKERREYLKKRNCTLGIRLARKLKKK